MRELTLVETEQASGGILPLIGAFIAGFFGSLSAAYAYEKAGGAAGIEKIASDIADAYIDSVAAQIEACAESGFACPSTPMM